MWLTKKLDMYDHAFLINYFQNNMTCKYLEDIVKNTDICDDICANIHNGWTLIHYVFNSSDLICILCMIRLCSSKNISFMIKNNDGNTPQDYIKNKFNIKKYTDKSIMYIIKSATTEEILFLLENINVTEILYEGWNIVHYIFQFQSFKNILITINYCHDKNIYYDTKTDRGNTCTTLLKFNNYFKGFDIYVMHTKPIFIYHEYISINTYTKNYLKNIIPQFSYDNIIKITSKIIDHDLDNNYIDDYILMYAHCDIILKYMENNKKLHEKIEKTIESINMNQNLSNDDIKNICDEINKYTDEMYICNEKVIFKQII